MGRSSAECAYISSMDPTVCKPLRTVGAWTNNYCVYQSFVRVSGDPDSGSLKGLLGKVSPFFFLHCTSIRNVQSPFLNSFRSAPLPFLHVRVAVCGGLRF